ncbi:SLAM family member 6 [Chionomys nivalis]|uniref:SLAM family member 6 n=1 Tax=Chionomys nivalis TaxID=269649 RepID=UPI002593E9AE|nr:SLAM family member 6 [Chionomys nivalis]
MAVSRAPVRDSARQIIWLFTLVFCLGSGNEVPQSSTSPKVVNGVLGESATLLLELPAGENASVIIWQHRGRESHDTAILIVQLNKSESPQITRMDPERGKRLNIAQSSSLQISNLTMADEGSYTAQISTNSRQYMFKYVLRVFERLNNLEVINHTRLFENGTCEIYLTCTVENPNHTASIGWQASGNISLGDPNLTVSWDPKNSRDQSYSCHALNPVSELSVSVSAQSLCTGVLTNENLYQYKEWLFGLVPIVTICIVICVCKKRRKRKGSLSLGRRQHPDSSENTDTPGSPGNTVYAQVTHPVKETEIPKSIKNDSMTIYSKVNHSREPVSPRMNTLKDIK